MKRSLLILSSLVLTSMIPALADHHEGWESLFDGKTLAGWKSNDEKPNVFTVVEGAIQVKGGRAHLFYDGDVNGGKFKDFEIKMKVKTTAGANGGFYFHTEFEEKGWPSKGYECQINTSHSDDRKTGSLYGIQDVLKNAPSHDDEWFDYQITVKGKNIKIAINGKDVVNYFLLAYIGIAGTAGVKAMLYSFVGDKFAEHDQDYIIDFVVKAIGLEL